MSGLIRDLELKKRALQGLDIEAFASGCHRYLKDGQLEAFRASSDRVKKTYGDGKYTLTQKCQRKANLPPTGRVEKGGPLFQKMRAADAFDSLCDWQFDTYAKLHRPPKLVYPLAAGFNSSVCQGLHPTAGINGSWAIDFCCQGGTPVVAVEDAWITRLSGRNPLIEPENLIGIWGWSMHYQTRAGYTYFSTHYGDRDVHEGQRVLAGEQIGLVGSWPGNPGRSHHHLGVVSPYGVSDAKKRILKVAGAPRVPIDV